MPRCFVIQPFDSGKFDKRYADVFKAAIEKAGYDAYRVDEDPSVAVPIEQIEAGIRGASVCFAEITTDNPNVWFELGFAIAERKHTVMVCSEERTSRFPFDVQHRAIIRYKTEAPQDFADLADRISARLRAISEREETIETVAQISPVKSVEGLEPHEIVALVTVAENLDVPDGAVSINTVRNEMERAGYTRIATTIALTSLSRKLLVAPGEVEGYNETYPGFGVSPKGMDWLIENRELLALEVPRRPDPEPDPDDIPF